MFTCFSDFSKMIVSVALIKNTFFHRTEMEDTVSFEICHYKENEKLQTTLNTLSIWKNFFFDERQPVTRTPNKTLCSIFSRQMTFLQKIQFSQNDKARSLNEASSIVFTGFCAATRKTITTKKTLTGTHRFYS